MHANNNGIGATLTEAFNDLESINALPEDFICSVMAELQILNQQFMKLIFSTSEFSIILVTGNSS